MNKTYYTLRVGKLDNEKIYPIKFETFKEAYHKLCNLWVESCLRKEEPELWGIWRTTETDYDGHHDSMTQAVWSE